MKSGPDTRVARKKRNVLSKDFFLFDLMCHKDGSLKRWVKPLLFLIFTIPIILVWMASPGTFNNIRSRGETVEELNLGRD
jgi:hypothetical protein